MILFVDETESREYFIVAGLLVDSEKTAENAFKTFKKKIRGVKLGEKAKSDLYTEFKANLMDRKYQRIKIKMLEEISNIDGAVVFSCYTKRNDKMNQVLKESMYITLLSSVVATLDKKTTIIFDRFGKSDFEERIIESTAVNPLVIATRPENSESSSGLKLIDNICSSIRLHMSGEDEYEFYPIIADMIREV